MNPRTALLLGVLLCGAGCSHRDAPGGSLWLLPADEPLEVAAASALRPELAALSSGTLALADRAGGPALGLGEVLTAVARSYPLLGQVELERTLAEARRLAALGAFDLTLRGQAGYQPNGYYENHSLDTWVEQRTGLWGASLFGGYRLGIGDFDPTWDGKRVTNHGGEVRVGLRVPLLLDREIDRPRRDLYQAEIGVELTAAQVEARRLELFREAARAYWAWVTAGQRLGVAEELLRLAALRQDQVAGRVRAGDLPALEGVDNERLVVRRRGLVAQARRAFEQAGLALSLFLRDAEGRPVLAGPDRLPAGLPPSESPDPLGVERDVVSALAQHPGLRALEHEERRLLVERRYAESRSLPELDLTVVASQDLDRDRPSATKGEFELAAGLELWFPFQRRAAEGQRLEAVTRLEQLALRRAFLRDKTALEVRDAASALRAAHERVEQGRRDVELAAQLARAERRAFELGNTTVLVLNLREEAAAEARDRLLVAQEEYWRSVAAYEAAVGVLPR